MKFNTESNKPVLTWPRKIFFAIEHKSKWILGILSGTRFF